MTVLSLSGCMWQTIDEVDIYYAKMLCDEKGSSLDSISEYFNGDSNIQCKGSAKQYSLDSYKSAVLSRGVKNDE